MRLGPGCCCEPPAVNPCLFAHDNFTRADNTDISTGSTFGWTEVAGDWSIASNLLTVATSNARAQCATIQADGGGCLANVLVKGVTDDEFKLIAADDGAGNYYYAELIIGTSKTLKIKSSAGATLATTAVTTTSGAFAEIIICLEANVIRASAGSSSVSATLTTPTSPRYVGLGTGAIAGTVYFSSFVAYSTVGDCPGCGQPCNDCVDAAPGELKLYIPPGYFSGAPDLSGTYYLPRITPFISGGCEWSLTVVDPIPTCGAFNLVIAAIAHSNDGFIQINFNAASAFGGAGACQAYAIWDTAHLPGVPADCDLTDEPLILQNTPGPPVDGGYTVDAGAGDALLSAA